MIGFNHVSKFDHLTAKDDSDDVIMTSRSRKSKWRQTDFGSEFHQVSSYQISIVYPKNADWYWNSLINDSTNKVADTCDRLRIHAYVRKSDSETVRF